MNGIGFRRQIWRAFTSREFSTWLLIVLATVLLAGSLLPNPEYMLPEAVTDLQTRHPLLFKIGTHFNSSKLATGYFFGFIGIYLIIAATLCSIDRLLAGRREQEEPSPSGFLSNMDVSLYVPSATEDETRLFVVSWLRRRLLGVKVSRCPESSVVLLRRGRLGFWGSLVFHTVLITALFGLVLFYLGGSRGKLVFTEGQRVRLEKSRFIHLDKEPLWGLTLPQVELELMAQYSLFAHTDPKTAIEHLARFRVTDFAGGGTSVSDVKINTPLRLDGKDFLLMAGGFAPRFVITRQDGTTGRFDSFVNLKKEAGTLDDFFALDGLHLEVRFFPDLAQEHGELTTRSSNLNNPAVYITLTKAGNRLLGELLPVGSQVTKAGYTVTVPEVRRWVQLEMVDEPGIGFFFFISFIGILGILVRLLDPDEQLVIRTCAEENGVQVKFTLYSRHFPALLVNVVNECALAAEAWGMERSKGRTA